MTDTNLSADRNFRIAEYDIIKGICIFLVAVMHTGHPVYFFEYGFLFAFFFVSGATFRRKSFGKFLKSKLLRIYIPFVLANFAGYLSAGFIIIYQDMAVTDLRFRKRQSVFSLFRLQRISCRRAGFCCRCFSWYLCFIFCIGLWIN